VLATGEDGDGGDGVLVAGKGDKGVGIKKLVSGIYSVSSKKQTE
jgi:hypothetical protein